jgi:hypothetical protein
VTIVISESGPDAVVGTSHITFNGTDIIYWRHEVLLEHFCQCEKAFFVQISLEDKSWICIGNVVQI